MAGAGQKPVRCAQAVGNTKQAACMLVLQMEGRNNGHAYRSKECSFFFLYRNFFIQAVKNVSKQTKSSL